MAKIFTLSATTRTKAGKAAKHLLESGRIPAVVYGHGVPSRSVDVEAIPFRKLYQTAGESSLIDLVEEGTAPVKVLIHDTQVDPMRGTITHVDFLQVNMQEKLTTEIAIAFVGESVAVKGLGGTLIKNHNDLEVECLPGDLVHEIPVDISVLATFEDTIRVKDLTPPPGITFLAEPEEVIALVAPPRSEEELKALEGTVEASVDKVEVVEKKKTDEEEAAVEAKES